MKKVQVITRPRTTSGYKGGKVLLLDENDAKEWIARKWADPVENSKVKGDRVVA